MPRAETSSDFQAHANDSDHFEDYPRQGYSWPESIRLATRALRAWEASYTDAYLFRVEQRTFSAPRIWRDIRVLSEITFHKFHKFHKVLQIAFGWEDRHLYNFHVFARGGSHEDKVEDKDDKHGGRELIETIKSRHKTRAACS